MLFKFISIAKFARYEALSKLYQWSNFLLQSGDEPCGDEPSIMESIKETKDRRKESLQ